MSWFPSTYQALDFPGASDDKESACNAEDPGSIPGLGRSPGEGNDSPLQYSCLENPMDRGAWRATVHGVPKSRTPLSDYHIQTYTRTEGADLKFSFIKTTKWRPSFYPAILIPPFLFPTLLFKWSPNRVTHPHVNLQGLQSCSTSSWHALKYWVTASRVWRGITVNYLHVQDWCWT